MIEPSAARKIIDDVAALDGLFQDVIDLTVGIEHYAAIAARFASVTDYQGTLYALEGLMEAAKRLQAVHRALKTSPAIGKPSP